MTYGSLFSGIGGMDLGFDRAGWNCAWQVESNEFCRRVLEKHWPLIPRYDNVIGFQPPSRPDAIIGGFPCQDISIAGKGAGIDGQRSRLWHEFERIIGVCRPRFAVIENVPAILGRGLDRVLCDLAELRYDAEWYCLPAAGLGAPHVRNRVFVVAYPNGFMVDKGNGICQSETWQASLSKAVYDQHAIANGWDMAAAQRASRMDDGVPPRLDRLRGLGNAVVPQVAQWIAERILQHA